MMVETRGRMDSLHPRWSAPGAGPHPAPAPREEVGQVAQVSCAHGKPSQHSFLGWELCHRVGGGYWSPLKLQASLLNSPP
jgi:hypothetical protein